MAEAERALVYIGRVVDDIVGCYVDITKIKGEIERIPVGNRNNGLDKRYEEKIAELGDFVGELMAVGVDLVDIERGIVNFPTRHTEDVGLFLRFEKGLSGVKWHHDPFLGSRKSLMIED